LPIVAAILGITLIACGVTSCSLLKDLYGGRGSAKTVTVEILRSSFQPETIEIVKDTTVIWINKDTIPHTITSSSCPCRHDFFDSGNLDPDEQFNFTFTEPGTYEYYCKIHPSVHGVVMVMDD